MSSLKFTREPFPDWKEGETRVVTYDLRVYTWYEAREDAKERFGRIHEDVTSQAESEQLGRAHFRVPKTPIKNTPKETPDNPWAAAVQRARK